MKIFKICQVTVQIDDAEVDTIVPPEGKKHIKLDNKETKEFCKPGKTNLLSYSRPA